MNVNSPSSSKSLERLLDFGTAVFEPSVGAVTPTPRYTSRLRLSPMRRYHPYPRFPSITGEEEDKGLLNAVYHDEDAILDIPSRHEPSPAERLDEIFGAIERVVHQERRAQLFPHIIVEFAAGLMRAQGSASVGAATNVPAPAHSQADVEDLDIPALSI